MPVMLTPRSARAVATRASDPGAIVELDREPDRHADTSCASMVPGPTTTLSGVATVLPRRVYLAIGLVLTHPWFHPIHRRLFALTGGRGPVGRALGMDMILVRMRGRRTGADRSIPLGAVREGDTWILIASNAGKEQMPAWVHNLRADGLVTVEHAGRSVAYPRPRGERRGLGSAVGGRDGGLPGVPGVSRAHRPPDPAVRAGACRLMPAPLGKTPTRKMPDIQVFGFSDSSADTRGAALLPRASDRGPPGRPAQAADRAGELRRFVDRLGARALLDETSRAYRDAGLAHLQPGRRRDRRPAARRPPAAPRCRSSATATR